MATGTIYPAINLEDPKFNPPILEASCQYPSIFLKAPQPCLTQTMERISPIKH